MIDGEAKTRFEIRCGQRAGESDRQRLIGHPSFAELGQRFGARRAARGERLGARDCGERLRVAGITNEERFDARDGVGQCLFAREQQHERGQRAGGEPAGRVTVRDSGELGAELECTPRRALGRETVIESRAPQAHRCAAHHAGAALAVVAGALASHLRFFESGEAACTGHALHMELAD